MSNAFCVVRCFVKEKAQNQCLNKGSVCAKFKFNELCDFGNQSDLIPENTISEEVFVIKSN